MANEKISIHSPKKTKRASRIPAVEESKETIEKKIAAARGSGPHNASPVKMGQEHKSTRTELPENSSLNSSADDVVLFSTLQPSLSPECVALCSSLGFLSPTPVQSATIPLLLRHKDVCVEANTGSGKTLAFVIPLAHMLARVAPPLKKHQVGAVILSPTRELAAQIADVARPFVQALSTCSVTLLVGGTSVDADVSRLSRDGANVIIATPGRLDDLMSKNTGLSFKTLELLVLDEADRLLEMGFRPCLRSILSLLPKQRRSALFSATLSSELEELARVGMRNPVKVRVRMQVRRATSAENGGGIPLSSSPALSLPPSAFTRTVAPAEDSLSSSLLVSATPQTLTIKVHLISPLFKSSHLVQFLLAHARQKAIVFFLTCASVEYWSSVLPRLPVLGGKGVRVFALHGRMKQVNREKVLSLFLRSPHAFLFCTDVGARGLDIPDVQAVLQFDPPQDPKSFVHRVGRTARMGREGVSTLFLHEGAEECYVDFLRLQNIHIPEENVLRPEEEEESEKGRTGEGEERNESETLDVKSEMDREMRETGCWNASLLTREEGEEELLGDCDRGQCEKAREKDERPSCSTSHSASLVSPVKQTEFSFRVGDVIEQLRLCSLRDRLCMERGLRAFVSVVRGYKEHVCNFIFRLQDLDLGRVALSFGLLRLPSMPEVKEAARRKEGKEEGRRENGRQRKGAGKEEQGRKEALSLPGFLPVEGVDVDAIKYKDKAREKARQLRLQKEREQRGNKLGKGDGEKGSAGKGTTHKGLSSAVDRSLPKKKLPKQKRDREDLSELEKDYRLLKKLKKGKISEEEFDHLSFA